MSQIFQATDLSVTFPVGTGSRRRLLSAVNRVSFDVQRGECLG